MKPLEKASLLEKTVETIQSFILNGKFNPGDSLPAEGTLARTLDVSRTLIREAMRVLEARGLVEISQGRRPRVRGGNPEAVSASLDVLIQQSEHGLLDLEARLGLEGVIAALAAKRATDNNIHDLEQAITQLEKGTSLDQLIEADLRFHDILTEATGNVIFKILLSPLIEMLRVSRKHTLSVAGTREAIKGHKAILDAIKKRSEEGARCAMIHHLDLAGKHIKLGK